LFFKGENAMSTQSQVSRRDAVAYVNTGANLIALAGIGLTYLDAAILLAGTIVSYRAIKE
jgi:hypothetical protein